MKALQSIGSVMVSVFFCVLLSLSLPHFSYGETCSWRIMPLGDSITKGTGSLDLTGYRKPLYDTLDLNPGDEIDLVGSLSDGPSTFDNNHEGHGGYTASQIAAGTYSWLKDNPSEIVLLHAGTNGLTTNVQYIGEILDQIDLFSPDTWVVLALIINREPYSTAVTQFNDNLYAMAQARIAKGDKLIVVDQEAALNYPDDLADSLHPNEEGYSKMAEVWADALEPLLDNLCSGPPQLISSAVEPIRRGSVGEFYTTTVKVYGDQNIFFALLDHPAGMTIDPASGVIQWVPTQTGPFEVTVQATNGFGSDTQDFAVVVTDPLDDVIIDNGGPGTLASGSWLVSGAIAPYGADSLYSKQLSATYTFEAALGGQQEVYLWWTQYGNRGADVPVRIYDGARLLATVTVDQTRDGGRWNLLGNYSFSGVARVVVVSTSKTLTACADAVRFAPLGSSPPVIVSEPATIGRVGAPYTSRVQADGDPVMVYELITAPAGMTIDPASGVIQWVPTQTGPFEVTVQATNGFGSDTQDFAVVVTDPLDDVIIDNGGPGTLASGSWLVSGAIAPYGADSLYSKQLSATYTFEAALGGQQEVYLWWTQYGNRGADVPVRIYDGARLLATVTVDQTRDGGRWNLLGNYSFSGVARVVVVSTSKTLTACADAVRFAPLGSSPPVIVSEPATIGRVGAPYTSRVQADGDPVMVYELITAPAGMTIDPASGVIQWVPTQTGPFEVTVQATNGFGSDTQDFAVVVTDPLDDVIIDNGGPGTLASGSWLVSGAIAPYGADSLYSKQLSATYTFEAALGGQQEVYLWWTQYGNRGADVPVRIYDGARLLATVTVDQTRDGGRWNLLGNYSFSGVARVVVVSTSKTLTACADAVRFAPLGSSPPVIVSEPATIGRVGAPYTSRVQADGDPVMVYELITAPAGMTIDPASGVIQWVPTQTGPFEVTVQATNGFGSDTQDFAVVVTDPLDDVIIDNGGPGTLASGSWLVSGAIAPYGADSLYSKQLSATYTFEAALGGQQEVYLWWTQYGNRGADVPVRIYDGARLLATVTVDQTRDGGRWNLLGNYSFSGVARVVVVSTSKTLTACADAVRFVAR